MRYNADGSLDSSFGDNGQVVTLYGRGSVSFAGRDVLVRMTEK